MCTANTYFCLTGDVHRCAANGLSSTLFDDCTASEYCAENDSSCNFQVCTPNAGVCNLNVATTCKPDGSGYQPGGTNCTLTGQLCAQGVCQTPICTANGRAPATP